MADKLAKVRMIKVKEALNKFKNDSSYTLPEFIRELERLTGA